MTSYIFQNTPSLLVWNWKSDKSKQSLGPSLLEERVTNSYHKEVSEGKIADDFEVKS